MFLWLVIAFAVKLPEALLPVGTDGGMYAYFGRALLQGDRPYVDFFDIHPPLVFLYWMLVEGIVGTDWGATCSPPIIRLIPEPACVGLAAHGLDALLTVIAAALVYAIARQVGASRGVAVLAGCLCVFYGNLALFSVEGSNPSKLVLVPSAFAAWTYLRYRAVGRPVWLLLAGAGGGLAAMAKQPGILVLAVLCLDALWVQPARNNSWIAGGQRVLILLGGAVIAILPMLAWLAAIGALGDFWYQVWIYNVQRLTNGYWTAPVAGQAPALTLPRLFREAGAFLLVTAAIGALALLARRPSASERFLLLWTAAGLAAFVLLREFVEGVPSLAVLAAVGIGALWSAASRGLSLGTPGAGRLALVGLLGTLLYLSTGGQQNVLFRAINDRGPRGFPSPEEVVAGQLRGSEFDPGPIFVFGNAGQIVGLSNRSVSSRYVIGEGIALPSPGSAERRAELVRELHARPPVVFITAADAEAAGLHAPEFTPVMQILVACYDVQVGKSEVEHRIYLRRNPAPGCTLPR